MSAAAEQLRLPLPDRIGDLGFAAVRWDWPPRKPDAGNPAGVDNGGDAARKGTSWVTSHH